MTNHLRHVGCLAFVVSFVISSGVCCSAFAADTNTAPPSTAIDYFEPAVLTGTIYDTDAKTKKALFTFRRTATRSGPTIRVLREYLDPAGAVVARERVQYEGGRLVSFEVDEINSGASGSVTISTNTPEAAGRKVIFSYAPDHDSPRKSSTEKYQDDILVNDMIGPYLTAHLPALMADGTVRFRYAAVARRETVGFKLVKESETTWGGVPVVMVKMEPTSWVIARLVEPLHFTVEKEGQHRVLRYVGRTTPRLQHGKKWDDLDAVSIYDWK